MGRVPPTQSDAALADAVLQNAAAPSCAGASMPPGPAAFRPSCAGPPTRQAPAAGRRRQSDLRLVPQCLGVHISRLLALRPNSQSAKGGLRSKRTDDRARLVDPVLLAAGPHRRSRVLGPRAGARGARHATFPAARERRRENRRGFALRRLRCLGGTFLPVHVVLRSTRPRAHAMSIHCQRICPAGHARRRVQGAHQGVLHRAERGRGRRVVALAHLGLKRGTRQASTEFRQLQIPTSLKHRHKMGAQAGATHRCPRAGCGLPG